MKAILFVSLFVSSHLISCKQGESNLKAIVDGKGNAYSMLPIILEPNGFTRFALVECRAPGGDQLIRELENSEKSLSLSRNKSLNLHSPEQQNVSHNCSLITRLVTITDIYNTLIVSDDINFLNEVETKGAVTVTDFRVLQQTMFLAMRGPFHTHKKSAFLLAMEAAEVDRGINDDVNVENLITFISPVGHGDKVFNPCHTEMKEFSYFDCLDGHYLPKNKQYESIKTLITKRMNELGFGLSLDQLTFNTIANDSQESLRLADDRNIKYLPLKKADFGGDQQRPIRSRAAAGSKWQRSTVPSSAQGQAPIAAPQTSQATAANPPPESKIDPYWAMEHYQREIANEYKQKPIPSVPPTFLRTDIPGPNGGHVFKDPSDGGLTYVNKEGQMAQWGPHKPMQVIFGNANFQASCSQKKTNDMQTSVERHACHTNEGNYYQVFGHTNAQQIHATSINQCTGERVEDGYGLEGQKCTPMLEKAGGTHSDRPRIPPRSGFGPTAQASCSTQDDVWKETESGCLNNSIGLVFSQISAQQFSYRNAEEYCRNLRQGGQSDWRLPHMQELSIQSHNGNWVYQELPYRLTGYWTAGALFMRVQNSKAVFNPKTGDQMNWRAVARVICVRQEFTRDGPYRI